MNTLEERIGKMKGVLEIKAKLQSLNDTLKKA